MSTFEAAAPEVIIELESPESVLPSEEVISIEITEVPIQLDVVRNERHRRNLMALPHEELVDKARTGDTAAFELLILDTADDNYGLAYRLTGSVEDAQDIVQEAYLRAYKAIGKFRSDSQFSTWMYRIVVNCANTHLERRRKHRHKDIDDAPPIVLADHNPENDPAQAAEVTTLREKVRAGLDALPATLRSVVVLRDVYDLSNSEIAQDLGISETAAKVRLHRARKQLREVVFPSSETLEETE